MNVVLDIDNMVQPTTMLEMDNWFCERVQKVRGQGRLQQRVINVTNEIRDMPYLYPISGSGMFIGVPFLNT